MSIYFNRRAKVFESKEEMLQRPMGQAGETLLGLDGLNIPDAGEPPTREEWAAFLRQLAESFGIEGFDPYLPRPTP